MRLLHVVCIATLLLAPAGAWASQAPACLPFCDDFTADIASGSPALWSAQNGTSWSVSSAGQLLCNSPTSSATSPATTAVTALTAADFTVNYDLTDGDGGFLFRQQPDGSAYYLIIRGGDAYWHDHNNRAGYWNWDGVGDYQGISLGNNRHVTFTAHGFDFTAIISDGTNSYTAHYTDAGQHYASGGIGFYSNSTTLAFDNVAITPEPASLAFLALATPLLLRRRAQ